MSSPAKAPGDTSLASSRRRSGDSVFAGLSVSAGVVILVTLALVAVFLVVQAMPAILAAPEEVRGGQGLVHYILPLLVGTIMAAVIALLVATPLAIGIAVFISHYAPRRLASVLGYLVDLLAAIPSVIFGLWGITVIGPGMMPLQKGLTEYLGFLPIFGGTASPRSMLVTGVVLAVMILPIMTAVNREVFLQTPRLHEEASLALGATRWEMIRQTVIPFGSSGVISGAMLGLGRALGETMAVAIILSASVRFTPIINSQANPGTIAGDIANQFPESSGLEVNTLIASGLVLFVLTLAVNVIARLIVSRRSEFSGAN